MSQKTVVVDLGDGMLVAVEAEQRGVQLVADEKIIAKFESVSGSVERVCKTVMDAVKAAGPSKATVELGFGFAVEEGQLVAMFGKGKLEASLNVTLEWSASESKDAK